MRTDGGIDDLAVETYFMLEELQKASSEFIRNPNDVNLKKNLKLIVDRSERVVSSCRSSLRRLGLDY